ncbi:LysM peptidoglycan-binding domain-containing protein, partial [Caldibacillus thermoamylovorans]|nr:LysM peptidoglycan-binding domain-containing protein [Caldibacillus thermoamylovorans]
AGDTISGIALKFGMTQSELIALNNISDPNKIRIGQVLKVYDNGSGSGGGSSDRKIINYTVQAGDTISGIALKFGMTQSELIALNNINDPNKIRIGQVLKVYDNGSGSGGGSSNRKIINYTVQAGDTISGIALKFGMTQSELIALNNINDPNKIRIGQVLKVYDNGSGSGGSGGGGSAPIGDGSKPVTRVTKSQLNQIGWPNSVLTDNMLAELNRCLEEFKITTKLRIAHFISQCSHESAAGLYTKELAPGWDYEYRQDLGNVNYGDGPKYKGGGYLQLTGRYNYTKFAEYIGDPEIVNQGVDYVAENYPWTSAGFWWHMNNMNALCDTNPTVEQVTRRVNGGTRGLQERIMYFNRTIQVF